MTDEQRLQQLEVENARLRKDISRLEAENHRLKFLTPNIPIVEPKSCDAVKDRPFTIRIP